MSKLPIDVSDQDWQDALDCAMSTLQKPFHISRSALDNAMQHAFGMLALREAAKERETTIDPDRLKNIRTLAANWKDIACDEEAAPTGSMLTVINELLSAVDKEPQR